MSEPNTSELNLHQKLAAITGELGAIKKGGRNNEQGYAFIEYAAVAGELRHLFAKYNVVIVPYMARTGNQKRQQFKTAKGSIGTTALIDFTFVVVNADKPDDKFSVSWTGEATDYGDKATNKAATSALKYYLMRQFNISEQGDDPDAESPKLTDKPAVVESEAPKPASPTKASKAQVTMMLGAVKRASGLIERQDIIDFFTEEVGKPPTEVLASEAGDIIKRFAKLPHPADDEVQV